MIFHGDLYARVYRAASAGLAYLYRVRNAPFDSALAFAVIAHAQNATNNRRPEGVGHPNSQRQVFFGGPPFILEELRSRANAPGPGMDLDAQPVRFGFYLLEMFFLEALVCIEIGDQDRVQLERR